MVKKLSFVFLFILAVTSTLAISYGSQPLAVVAKVTGPAWVIRTQNQNDPLTKGMELKADDQVKTGQQGTAIIRFCDRHTVRLEPNSLLKITGIDKSDHKESVSLYLVVGEILIDVWKRAQTSLGFEVETEAGIAGVRGTKFTVTVDSDGKMDVWVEKGLVELKSKFDGSKVELSKNQSSSVIPGNPPAQPEKAANKKSKTVKENNRNKNEKGSNNGNGKGNSGNGGNGGNGGHGGGKK